MILDVRNKPAKKLSMSVLVILMIVTTISFFSAASWAQVRPESQSRNTRLRVVYPSVSPTYSAAWIAQEGGYLKEQGLDVEYVYISGGSRVVQAMLAGEAPIVFAGGRALVNATLGGADLVMIAAVVNVPAYYLMALPEIQSIQDLRGKKVGIIRIGETSDFAVRLVLRKAGLVPYKDVTLVQIGEQSSLAAALAARVIAAAAFVPPFNLQVEKGGAKLLVDMAKIGAHYPHTSLVSSRRFLANSNETVRKYLIAYAKGLRRLVEDPSFSKTVLSRFTKTTEPQYHDTMYRFALDFIEKVPYPSREAILETIQESESPRAKTAKPEDFFDDQIVRDLDRQGYFPGKAKR